MTLAAVALIGGLLVTAAITPATVAEAKTNEGNVTLVANVGGYGHGFPGSLQFRYPWAVDAGADGDLYVVERSLGHVRHVGPSGDDLGSWGSTGSGDGQFDSPRGVAVAPDGSVYVGDTDNHRIQHFTAAGAFLGSWGTSGSAPGQFSRPHGLAVASNGTVYVADTGNDRIQAFTPTGTFVTAWGPNPGPQAIDAPVDVALAPDGTVVVANDAASLSGGKVQRYTSAGTFVAQWAPGSFGPVAVDVGPDGRVYVSDDGSSTGRHRVAILDAALSNPVEFGNPDAFPRPGVSKLPPGELWSPRGLAIDGSGVVSVVDSNPTNGSNILDQTDWVNRFDGNGSFLTRLGTADTDSSPQLDTVTDVAPAPSGDLYAVDVGNNRVLRLSAAGAYLSSWGGGPLPGTAPGQFSAPESVAVDATGDVYVADTGNDRVQRFGADGTFEAQWGSAGSGHGQFDGPAGIVVDVTGDVFVADSGNDRVQRFSSAGTFEGAWRGGLDDPGDLALGVGPSLYVADRGHGRVLRFTRAGGTLPLFERVDMAVDQAVGAGARAAAGVATDQLGNLYVSIGAGSIAKYSRSGILARTYGLGDQFVTRQRWAVAVDDQRRLVTSGVDTSTSGAGRSQLSIHQLPSGSFVAVRANFDVPSGSVGRPFGATVGVVNTGTTPLTGVSLVDVNAPGCAGPVPDLAPGEEHIVRCEVVRGSPGTFTHSATVDTDQTAALVSEVASVDVSVAPGAMLLDDWGVAGDGPGQLERPEALAVDAAGDVVVANTGNDVVSRFDGAGVFESDFASSDPDDVDVDPAGNVFTLRSSGGSAAVLASWTSAGSPRWTTGPGYGSGIGANQDGRVWRVTPSVVICGDAPPCSVLSEAKAWRHSLTGSVDLSFPIIADDLAVDDAHDRIYATDDGFGLRTYTLSAQLLGSMFLATDSSTRIEVDTDAGGRVYAAIQDVGRAGVVKVFDPTTGTLLARWEAPRADGISVGPDGTVYVLDRAGNRVRRYGLGVSGQVTDSGSGVPVPGAWVLGIDPVTGRTSGSVAGSDGRYLANTGLGARWVGFLDPSGGHAGEWFDDHQLSDLDHADLVAVAGGAPNVADAALAPSGHTASVSGTVTADGGGGPLAGVFVGVVDLSTGVFVGGAATAGDGSYVVDGLEAGPHLVMLVDPTGAHQREFFDDGADLSSAHVVNLAAGQGTVADVGLAPASPAGTGSHLSGTVKGDGDPLEGALVLALDAADFSVVRGGYTDASGAYDLALPAGSYRLAFVDLSGSYAGEWYAEAPLSDLGSSSTVVVGPGATVDVDAGLEPTGFTGSVEGTVLGPDGEAAQRVWVAVLDASSFGFVAGGVVDGDGAYEVGGLAAGSYVVAFLDPAGGYAVEWYQDAPNVGTATLVAVAANEATTVDATLAALP